MHGTTYMHYGLGVPLLLPVCLPINTVATKHAVITASPSCLPLSVMLAGYNTRHSYRQALSMPHT